MSEPLRRSNTTKVYEVQSSGEPSDMNDAQPKEWPFASPKALSPSGNTVLDARSPSPPSSLAAGHPTGQAASGGGSAQSEAVKPAGNAGAVKEVRDATYFRFPGTVCMQFVNQRTLKYMYASIII